MAPGVFSAYLSPISLPHHRLTCVNPQFIRIKSKSYPAICNVAQSKTQHELPVSDDEVEVPVSVPEHGGRGAAAPGRGERFLERQRAFEAAKLVMKEAKKKRKNDRVKTLKVNTAVACCYGCGAPLQTSELDAPGYVAVDTYELKKKHRQLRTVLCGRCKLLSHGHMITAVGGNGGYSGGKQFVTADELREKLSHLRNEKALIVKLVDIVDFNGSFLARVRDLAGANPIILVITKGRDVYILGSANVGKSAFINALLKMMAERDPAAAAARKYKPIQSAVPGTTLGPIQIDAFLGGAKLFDTPGVHLHHRQAAVVHSEDLPILAPRSRLKAQVFPNAIVAGENGIAEKLESDGLNSFTIFWGGLVRIDVLKVLPETSLTFYGPKALKIHIVHSDKADEYYQNEVGVSLTPPTGKDKAESWKGLEIQRQLCIKFEEAHRPASDIAISGLGWIAVEPVRKSLTPQSSDLQLEESAKELHFVVHVPKPVEIFVRPPLPVGKAGEMHIKEVSLEGFKSYATRTVVKGFDKCFNAITGLNGSGKSNILDSICFVLGITNLQQVRASNLQELVYKQGQAGITKATVSVVFDNSDRSRSPLGYEDHSEITVTRQIVVGGRNKYLINGKLAQPSQVQNLFHSVQLNVNNPHFLIMQGRITKVLNMKPPEILSMLEEAAGTRMYETKKDSALKTLEKKQGKVDEINKLLDHEILPALEKLRKERMQYMQWANGNAELDRLKRFCIAYEYVQAERIRDTAVGEVEEIKGKIREIDDNTEKMQVEIKEMETEVSKLTAEKEARMGGEVKVLSDKVDALSQDLVREVSVLSNKEDTLQGESQNAEKIVHNIEDLKQSIEDKATAVKRCEDGAADVKQRAEQLSKSLEDYEKEYQGVLAGKSSGNEEKCLEDQLSEAKGAVGNAETELKQLKTKISHCEKELNDKRKQLNSKRQEAVSVENELNARKEDLDNVKSALESLPYKEGQMEALEKDRASEMELVQKLKDETRAHSAHLSNVQFTYRDPAKNFDRTKVKGVVAKLIEVKDKSAMTALEVTAGGKLYNVVVDTENTGKQLLQNGELRRRVTIIPLNKIQAHRVPPRVQQAAAKLVGKENAELALSLVGYDEELKNAMEYVFGSTFVCKNIDAAKEVAFSREIRTPSVTLEGDIFQPSGLLTGGSRRGGGDLLRQLYELAEAESKLRLHQERLSEIDAKIKELLPLYRKFVDLRKQLELKMYDLSLFQGRAEQNEHHKLGELVKKIEQDLDDAKVAAEEKQTLYDQCVSSVAQLEKSIKEHDNSRETRLKDLEKKVKKIKAQMQSASKNLKEHEHERERMVLEREAVIKEHASLESQLASLMAQINSLGVEVQEQKAKVASIRVNCDSAQSELDSVRHKMKECDTQISSIVKEQQKRQHKITEIKLERKKLENEVKRMEMEHKDCSTRVEKLLEKHAWIVTEKQLFGRSGTDYDFESRDPHRAKAELEKLEAEQSGLEKRVNKKVMAMFEKAEDEYNGLMSKKKIIENDKSKINKVIEELDEKKKETLEVTWVKVNRQLEPPEGCSFLDGLEVRVAFGSVWKQSLSELSGGQRSLIALSLILALLRFKPAPLYILDEVDAALDLSHTQNIGKMIKAQFPQSQFIVVSLKEGMFNNANVIFRTKFVDGVSTVQVTAAAKQSE
ncbi:unnamed protein product [Linum tenue]|uniref:SMC hinge domain-containing protein n=1 Tax=Linum tenue TaxID=586396 RepID=A0AAV0J3P0_9ROSI|nr:unnamed protein product [Linum tenue]